MSRLAPSRVRLIVAVRLDVTSAIAGQLGSAVSVTTGNGVGDPLGLALPDGLALAVGLALVVVLVVAVLVVVAVLLLVVGLAPPVGLALVAGLGEALMVMVGSRPGLALIVTGDVALAVGAGALAVGAGARLVAGLVDRGRPVAGVVLGAAVPARGLPAGSGSVVIPVGTTTDGVVPATVNGTVPDVPSHGVAVSVTTPFAPVRGPLGVPAAPSSLEVS